MSAFQQLGDQDDPDYPRSSFLHTTYARALPIITERYPNIGVVYLIKIFRGTIHPSALVWMDVDREMATPEESSDISHLLYCFEVYGQIICLFAADGDSASQVLELQEALAEYRMRLLRLVSFCTFESLRAWHGAFLTEVIHAGQDKPSEWRQRREGLTKLLTRKQGVPGM